MSKACIVVFNIQLLNTINVYNIQIQTSAANRFLMQYKSCIQIIDIK